MAAINDIDGKLFRRPNFEFSIGVQGVGLANGLEVKIVPNNPGHGPWKWKGKLSGVSGASTGTANLKATLGMGGLAEPDQDEETETEFATRDMPAAAAAAPFKTETVSVTVGGGGSTDIPGVEVVD